MVGHQRAVRDCAVAGLRLDQLHQLVAHLGRAAADAAGQRQRRPVHLVAALRRQRAVVENRLRAIGAIDDRGARRERQTVRCDLDAVAVRRRPAPRCIRTPAGLGPVPVPWTYSA